MTESYTVGGDVQSWCTKCKLMLRHTIVAMVENSPKRVQCNTCSGAHNYRAGEPVKSASKPRVPKAPKREKSAIEYLERLETADMSMAKKYNFAGNFEKDELINHPKFGLGIVSLVKNEKKMEIVFKDSTRLLSQNQS
ncbi:MAG: hypothetical protein ISR96_12510 [Nitrospira sp.]|nr:hypothetical protein [bacterium]MBL7050327.1 hypothetical protein [Nitrospira sp.]